MLIACRSFFFAALQFFVITSYYVSLRLAKKKQQCTLNTTHLRILGSIGLRSKRGHVMLNTFLIPSDPFLETTDEYLAP